MLEMWRIETASLYLVHEMSQMTRSAGSVAFIPLNYFVQQQPIQYAKSSYKHELHGASIVSLADTNTVKVQGKGRKKQIAEQLDSKLKNQRHYLTKTNWQVKIGTSWKIGLIRKRTPSCT